MSESDDLNYGSTLRGLRKDMRVFRDRYLLKERVGRGGMGEVWLAEDEELERRVALKFLPEVIARDPAAIRDMKREASRSLELTHANIVRVYDFLSDGYFAAISMEFVDGESLASVKSRQAQGFLEWDVVKKWMPQLCAALSYAHSDGKVVHRDLKPANILLTKAGAVKVADFGISASITDTVTRVSAHASSSGTPVYMSPQQMMGDDPGISDDIYSLGATLYELLSGKPPFYTGNVIIQVQSKSPPSLSERRKALGLEGKSVPDSVEKLIASCLSKEVSKRPESLAEVERLIRASSHHGTPIQFPSKESSGSPEAKKSSSKPPPIPQVKPDSAPALEVSQPPISQVEKRVSSVSPPPIRKAKPVVISMPKVEAVPSSDQPPVKETRGDSLDKTRAKKRRTSAVKIGFWVGLAYALLIFSIEEISYYFDLYEILPEVVNTNIDTLSYPAGIVWEYFDKKHVIEGVMEAYIDQVEGAEILMSELAINDSYDVVEMAREFLEVSGYSPNLGVIFDSGIYLIFCTMWGVIVGTLFGLLVVLLRSIVK